LVPDGLTVNGIFPNHNLINGTAAIIRQTVVDIAIRAYETNDIVNVGIEGI